MASQQTNIDTVVLDVDGTLVDTVYQHTVMWAQAFASVGVDVPMWKLHRAIGMGGDRLVTEVAGEDVEEKYGDQVRAEHDERFGAVLDDIRPLPGAAELLETLRDRGFRVALASSGIEEQTKRLLGHFGGEERSHAWTSSDDVDDSKPEPDLIQVAMEKVGASHALVIGDAVWDITAAEKAGLPSIGLRCGGFGEAELLDAGAAQVFRDPQDLLDHLDQTALVLRWFNSTRRRTPHGEPILLTRRASDSAWASQAPLSAAEPGGSSRGSGSAAAWARGSRSRRRAGWPDRG